MQLNASPVRRWTTVARACAISAAAVLVAMPAASACGGTSAAGSAARGTASAASERGAPGQAPDDGFDGGRALEDARRMVELGPRPLGTEALERTRGFIEERLTAAGLEPRRDEFIADTPMGDVPMANILADVAPATDEGLPTLLIGGHFDTKLFEEFEFVGANDGASSAALLLELGRVLAASPPPLPVQLVFFDGEEAVRAWGPRDGTYGSRHMVQRLFREERLGEIGALVLVDMVGDADLGIAREGNSTPWLTELIWQAAEGLGHGEHFESRLQFIEDDHVPFLRAGVDAVDLIDFQYGPGNRYWHAPFDTLDRISADSLQVVGETVLAALPAIAERLGDRAGLR